MYRVQDPEERAVLSSILKQLSTIADKLAKAGSSTFAPSRPASGGGLAAQPAASAADGGPDPLLALLDGLYRAVVVDSGLRDFLVGERKRASVFLNSEKLFPCKFRPVRRQAAGRQRRCVHGQLVVLCSRGCTSCSLRGGSRWCLLPHQVRTSVV